MQALGAYILSVTAAALVCAIATGLLGKQGTAASVGKILVGLFLLFCIIRPLRQLRIGDFTDWSEDFSGMASDAAALGENAAREAMAEGIRARTRAYILDKAAALQVQIDVEVTLSQDAIPVPVAVTVRGKVSPYAKAQLQHILQQDLGIAKENQVWT